jgi:predicted double-glycine peptidase
MTAIMEQNAEAGGVALPVAMDVLIGPGASRLRGQYWIAGYLMPLAIITAIAAARRVPLLEFVPPISWLMHGRTEFVALGFACAGLLTTLLARMSGKRMKILVGIFMIIAILYLSALPFAFPPMLRNYQSRLEANFDSFGVCLQSNHFNCGPAAAVTALRALGVSASEGEIAILARTNPASGTQPDILSSALQDGYGKMGISCEYRLFKSAEDLEGNVPAITLIKLNPITDHHVAVLDVTDEKITLGDPLEGRRIMSRAEFENVWRRLGIVVRRNTTERS